MNLKVIAANKFLWIREGRNPADGKSRGKPTIGPSDGRMLIKADRHLTGPLGSFGQLGENKLGSSG